jgi:hypothetical protein
MLHVREENSMSRTSKCFDEYGNYGENNGPLPPRVEIREMTDEERQRAKEREAANKQGDSDD